ncbi:hypothetical protein DSO57_1037027 [Entomophthora muscae]|uniref:Uncharacterized protein n=1 Tax=Entomophthora muscae TaxID=34485 RepID=A0ACC2SN73_9FUNG|nr:hypothetical protein DSO57_1037027 [Entomophthora muscae]
MTIFFKHEPGKTEIGFDVDCNTKRVRAGVVTKKDAVSFSIDFTKNHPVPGREILNAEKMQVKISLGRPSQIMQAAIISDEYDSEINHVGSNVETPAQVDSAGPDMQTEKDYVIPENFQSCQDEKANLPMIPLRHTAPK